MLEYVFFDETIAGNFMSLCLEKGVHAQISEEMPTIVEVDEDVSAAVGDSIDEAYERMLQENAELVEQGEDALEKNVAGVNIILADGTLCTIRLDPNLVGRMLNSISMEELRDLVQTIAEGVENPDNRPLCHT